MVGINCRSWSSSNHGKEFSEDQHKKGKKWYVTTAPKRVKLRWNKKKGLLEKTKKGAREFFIWAS